MVSIPCWFLLLWQSSLADAGWHHSCTCAEVPAHRDHAGDVSWAVPSQLSLHAEERCKQAYSCIFLKRRHRMSLLQIKAQCSQFVTTELQFHFKSQRYILYWCAYWPNCSWTVIFVSLIVSIHWVLIGSLFLEDYGWVQVFRIKKK